MQHGSSTRYRGRPGHWQILALPLIYNGASNDSLMNCTLAVVCVREPHVVLVGSSGLHAGPLGVGDRALLAGGRNHSHGDSRPY